MGICTSRLSRPTGAEAHESAARPASPARQPATVPTPATQFNTELQRQEPTSGVGRPTSPSPRQSGEGSATAAATSNEPATSRPGTPPNEAHNMDLLARHAYATNRYYHGTTADAQQSIRGNGMSVAQKTDGATSGFLRTYGNEPGMAELGSDPGFRNMVQNTRHYNYVATVPKTTTGEMSATEYARVAAGDNGQPKLVRAYLPRGTVSLHRDPDSMGPDQRTVSFRTQESISPGYILPPKNSPVAPTQASEAFKDAFNTSPMRPTLRVDTAINSADAAQMLRGQQTDSASDFAPTPTAASPASSHSGDES